MFFLTLQGVSPIFEQSETSPVVLGFFVLEVL